jgi:hypothetical protein
VGGWCAVGHQAVFSITGYRLTRPRLEVVESGEAEALRGVEEPRRPHMGYDLSVGDHGRGVVLLTAISSSMCMCDNPVILACIS